MQKRKLNPFSSLLVTLMNFLRLRIHFSKNYNGQHLKMPDGETFEIFRHVIVGDKNTIATENGALFIVRFKLDKMSVEKNIRFSRFPIPMFIGLSGFRAKFWFLNRQTGYNQGVYQWKTEQDAINYSKSFAVKFMSNRSVPNTVSYKIIPNKNIYEYLESKI